MLTRRQFSMSLLGTGAAIGTGGSLQQPWELLPDLSTSADRPYDLLIQGGTVIDPARNVQSVLDVAVRDGKIAQISPNIPHEKSHKTISAAGKLVTPGLIDIHVHVYDGATEAGINADHYCIGHGVTTAVDAGSAGYPSIAGLRKYVINPSDTRLYALLDIGALGTLVGIKDAMENLEWVNPERAAKAANDNKPVVIGIKARLSKDVAGTNDIEGLRRARRAAEDSRLPIMVHIGDTVSPLREILELLRPGDIVTHCYTPRPHGIVDENGKVLPEIRDARQRGILFDVGHGTFHFGFDLTEKCLQQGFLPDSISSDLAGRSVNGPTFDLLTTVSKFLLLGLPLDKALELVTSKPAHVFDFGLELGTLKPGGPADISILALQGGKFEF
ncbi:MAG TPA: amidohydrolase/deacetylase family metallohydrolase, partial [Candidatus Acidoferrum sp.]|nr:amidohydrolase/deacetylase family metallohydrolase [Candidatus Acidoferrum sp.]